MPATVDDPTTTGLMSSAVHGDEGDQPAADTHLRHVALISHLQEERMVAQPVPTSEEDAAPSFDVIQGGQGSLDDHRRDAALGSLIGEIRETHKQRQDLLKSELGIRNRIWSIHDRMNTPPEVRAARSRSDWERAKAAPSVTELSQAAALPHVGAADMLALERKKLEKRMAALATQLPVYPWVESIRGFGAFGLAQIIGETGDLSNYANPAKVWKRMGLAVMPDGTRQRKVSGADALDHGYNPTRRSLMFVIGDSLIKGNRDGVYRTLYLTRKEYEQETHPDLTPMAHHRRAQRYMEKRLLRDLWRAWRAEKTL